MSAETIIGMLFAGYWGWALRSLQIERAKPSREQEVGALILQKAEKARSNIKFIGPGWESGSQFTLCKEGQPDVHVKVWTELVQ